MRRLGSSLRPAGRRGTCGSWTSGRGAAPSRSRWPSRCGGSTRSTRSSSWPSTSRPTRSGWPARTRSATRSRTGSRSPRPTCCPMARAALRPGPRQPAVRPPRRDGRPAGGVLVRAGDRARRRRGRAGGHRPAARPAARGAGGRRRGPARDRCRPGRGDRGARGREAVRAGGARSSPTWPACRASPGSPARRRSAARSA